MQYLNEEQIADREQLADSAALIASVGGARGYADWTNPDHRLRRLLAEFIGMAGLTFVLSGGAAILARNSGDGLQPWQTVLVLSLASALWLVVAVYFLGHISAHFHVSRQAALIRPGALQVAQVRECGYWVAVRARSRTPAVVPTYMSRVMR